MEGWEAEPDNSRSMYVCAHSPSCTMRFGEHVILGTILRPLLSLSMLLREITHKFTFRIRVSAAIPEIDIDISTCKKSCTSRPPNRCMAECIIAFTLYIEHTFRRYIRMRTGTEVPWGRQSGWIVVGSNTDCNGMREGNEGMSHRVHKMPLVVRTSGPRES